ncbi:MAG: S53 family peptidase [Janthinobacterium lividum]
MHLRSRRARLLVAASTLLVPAGLLATVQSASAAPTGLVTIKSTLPTWLPKTKAKIAVKAAGVSADKTLTVRVYLAPTGGADALAKAALAVSTPGSSSYGRFMTADQFHAAYAPSAAAEQSVRSFLTSKGLTVTDTGPFRRYVTAQGTIAQLDHTFGVTLKTFSHAGQSVVAPTTAAALPAKVAASVLTIDGLDTTKIKATHQAAPAVDPPAGFKNGRPCSRSYGQVAAKSEADYKTALPTLHGQTLPYAVCGYTGSQLRTAYEGGSALTGAGATIAITDAFRWGYIASDANRYASQNGDGGYAAGQLTENLPAGYHDGGPKSCDASGWSGEETLDVEAVHAMAPAANVRYYASSSCFDDDFADTLARVADEDVVQAVTNSWGEAEADEAADLIPVYESVFQQSALEGISVLFSSGDNGDELANTGTKQADYPASDPYVTAVGGTATGIGSDGKRTFDAAWGTARYNLSANGHYWARQGYAYGGGGGVSGLFEQPSYQAGVVPGRFDNGRAVPDVAMDADPTTGMLVGQTQAFANGTYYAEYRIGGTSLASPLLAGLTALAVQNNQGRGFGLLNPTLYKKSSLSDDVVKKPADLGNVRSDYINGENNADGLRYTVRTFGEDSSLTVAKGWDAATGLGVPNTSYLKLTTPAPAAVAAVKR